MIIKGFLTTYLVVTGIGAFLALAMPSLVVIGLFMLIIPGLILGLMPSAFMYGVIFTAGWIVARAFFGHGIIAVMAGIVAVVIVSTTITKPSRLRDMATYKASILPDVTPAAPIELRGDVRFNLKDIRINKTQIPGHLYKAGQAGYACESYCLAALFTPGVTSVTIDKAGFDDQGKPSIEARTYRLARRPDCRSNIEIDFDSIRAPLQGEPGGGIRNHEDGKVLVSKWAMKLASEFCLVMEPALRNHHFTITERNTDGQYIRDKWAFGPGRLSTQTVEIHQGSDLVYRAHQSSITTLSKILFIEGNGGIENFSFGWSRQTTHSKRGHDSVTLQKSVGSSTNLAGRPVAGASKKKAAAEMLPLYRTQLQAALNDPSLNDKSPAFKVMEQYFSAVGDPAAPEDIELISRLFADQRISRYEGAWHLKLPIGQMIPIYNAYTRRIIAQDYSPTFQRSLMDNAVSKLGADSYKLIAALQKPLLDDPIKRLAVPELVKALGYGPEINGRNLFNILKQHAWAKADIDRRRKSRELKGYGEQVERDAHTTLIGAAKIGLCLMAPNDAALRQDIDDFLRAGVLMDHEVQGHNRTDWDVLLVRMGKPLSNVEKPENLSGTVDQHRKRVGERVSRWKPEDCHRM
jgi:hypothetical protein